MAFLSFQGTIAMIDDFWMGNGVKVGCHKIMSVQNTDGQIVNFIVMPNTYFVDNVTMSVGDEVIGFYDSNAPAPSFIPRNIPLSLWQSICPIGMLKLTFLTNSLSAAMVH